MQTTKAAKYQESGLSGRSSIGDAQVAIDQEDFERTAVPHMSALYNHALRLTMNADDAKDLVQETYLKAYRFWGTFERGTNIKAWLYQIMKNSFINHYRKRVKEPRPVEFDENISHVIPQGNASMEAHHAGQGAPHDIFEDEVARSLDSLSADFRTVVVMSDVEDLTYEEIASAIDVPIGTVRSRLHRGRNLLKKRLQYYAKRNRYLV